MPGCRSDHGPVIVIDTREQKPYAFDPDRAPTLTRMLPAGDYSLAGLEEDVAIERKSLDDLVNTVIWEWDRFEKELLVLGTYDAACIVVEGDLTDIRQGRYRSAAHPNAVLGRLLAIQLRHRIPVLFGSNRDAARWLVETYLRRYHRERVAVEGRR